MSVWYEVLDYKNVYHNICNKSLALFALDKYLMNNKIWFIDIRKYIRYIYTKYIYFIFILGRGISLSITYYIIT